MKPIRKVDYVRVRHSWISAVLLVLVACGSPDQGSTATSLPSAGDSTPPGSAGDPAELGSAVAVTVTSVVDITPEMVEGPSVVASDAGTVTPVETPSDVTGAPCPEESRAPAASTAVGSADASGSGGPIPSPRPLPVVNVPAADDAAITARAQDSGIQPVPLARDHTVIYAYPDSGIAFLLTPPRDELSVTACQLQQVPGLLQQVMLGGLTVVQQVHTGLAPGNYVVSLAPEGDRWQVVFTGAQRTQYPAVVSELPEDDRLPRPVAMISARQFCLAWARVVVCAQVPTPPTPALLDRMNQAISRFQVMGAINAELTIPDIEGVDVLGLCGRVLSATPPDYAACRASVLAAPAIADDAFPVAGEGPTDRVSGIGVLVVLTPVLEDFFRDADLTQRIDAVQPGDYLISEVRRPGDRVIAGDVVATRVRLTDGAVAVYQPAVSGARLIGEPVGVAGPTDTDEAVIANLWVRRRCFYKWRQCPWLR